MQREQKNEDKGTKIYGSKCWCQSLTIFGVLCIQRRLFIAMLLMLDTECWCHIRNLHLEACNYLGAYAFFLTIKKNLKITTLILYTIQHRIHIIELTVQVYNLFFASEQCTKMQIRFSYFCMWFIRFENIHEFENVWCDNKAIL